MLYEFIKKASIKVVATWPAKDKGHPNTFRIASAVSDIDSPPSFNEYLKGEFFSRTWILSGADPSTILLERPLVVMERDTISMPSTYSKKQCTSVWFSVIDTLCTECDETPDIATKRVIDTLHNFLLRMGKMKVWKQEISGSYVYVVAVDQPTGFILHRDRFFEDKELKIIPNPRLVQNAGFAASVNVEFCEGLCNDIEFLPFNHPLPNGEPTCEVC